MTFILRPMEEKDLSVTFDWRNDPKVLENAQTSNPISYKEHEAMFKFNNALKLIFEVDSVPAGYVSCTQDSEKPYGEWSFHMGANFRGQGLSELMLKAALYYLKKEEAYECICATVWQHNNASNYLHAKLGFAEGETKDNFRSYYLYL